MQFKRRLLTIPIGFNTLGFFVILEMVYILIGWIDLDLGLADRGQRRLIDLTIPRKAYRLPRIQSTIAARSKIQ